MITKLLRGYPMQYSDEWCFDCWFWNPVDLYVDRMGRKWLASGPWDFRRIRLLEAKK